MADTEKMSVNTTSDVFALPISVTSDGTYTRILHTADTYVDKNIEVKVTVPDATYKTINAGTVTATAGVATNDYTTTTNTGYAITATADGAVSDVKIGIDQAGFAASDDTVTITGSSATQATKTVYIKAGALKNANGGAVTATAGLTDSDYLTTTNTGYAVTATADASSANSTTGVTTAGWIPTTATATVTGQTATQATATKYIKAGALKANSGTATATGNGVALGDATTTAPTGHYITVTGSGEVGVETAGWIPASATKTSSTATVYYPVDGATLTNTATSGVSYTEIDANSNANVVIPSNGYLYINGGYIDNTKISLATLVPNEATIVASAQDTSDMMRGISAYDKDGKLIAGSMPDAVLDASASVTAVGVTYNTGNANYDVTVTGSSTASTTTTGYATKGTTSDTGTVTSTATLAKGVIELGGGTAVTPAIAKTTDGNAKSGDATTSKPADGYYVAVKSGATSSTVTSSITTEGYVDATNTAKPSKEVTVNASAVTYVPLTAASHSISKGADGTVTPVIAKTANTNAKTGTLTTTKPSSGNYVAVNTAAISQSTTVECTSTEGYITATTQTVDVTGGATAATEAYIPITAGSVTYTNAADDGGVKQGAHSGTATVDTTITATGDVTPVTYSKDDKEIGVNYIAINTTTDTENGYYSYLLNPTVTEGYITTADSISVTAAPVGVTATEATTKYIKVYDGTFL